MFQPKTEKIKKITELHQQRIERLETFFIGDVGIYIDYANVRPWSVKLNWNIDLKRLKQFLDSFDNVKSVNFYDGTLKGDKNSEKLAEFARKIFKDGFKTKAVKLIRQSIDYTSISSNSADLLGKFIRKCLLRKYELETIEYLNLKFKEMNERGIYYIEDRKCNFDVELGRDILLDYERNNIETFVLWSGDSDFRDPIEYLLKNNKNVILFATAGRVARELNDLKSKGLEIFDIQKIREFICWKRQI